MAQYIRGASLRELEFGFQVVKSAQPLPQSTTAAFYTVSGGSVMVTSLFGVVSTAIQNQSCNLSLGLAPTTGTSSNTSLGTNAAITNLEAGTWLAPNNPSGGKGGGALTVGTNASTPMYVNTSPFVSPAGSITWTTSASNTGAVSWYLTFVPLDGAAYVS